MITKQTSDFSTVDFVTGETLLIDKPLHWSSFKVIHKLRQIIGVKKIGHAGTLDPLATGLLIICTGKKTKQISTFQDLQKIYTGTITLGGVTASMDSEKEVTDIKPFNLITEEEILTAKKLFEGEIEQTPPMYSAVNYGGKKLYELARKGKTVERSTRSITVHNFSITKIALPEIDFEITCSKGTYIRVLANDLGEKLGCGAYLSGLRRTAIGDFSVSDALTVEEFAEKYGKEALHFAGNEA
ncbi:MAG: tRNA pseudouridine(55) synthase TruB [Ignavibacteriaceae bacterium]|jgi:tRNA pseudouridine55 synthase